MKAAALLLVALVLPFAVTGYHVFQLTQLVVYAIAILGLDLLTGYTGQISLGNGAFYALGPYAAAIRMGDAHVPYWRTRPLAGAVCFAAGYLFGRPAARLEGLYLALATFALAVVTPQLLKHDRLAAWTGGSQGVVLDKPVSPLAVFTDDQWLYVFCVLVAAPLFVAGHRLVHSTTGRALTALRDQPIAAAAMGIDVAHHKAVSFGISALYTGVAGALAATLTGFVSPDSFPLALSIQLLVGGVVGGIASIAGSVVGAGFLELVPALARQLSDRAPGVIDGVLLIVCMKLAPGGAAGLVRSMLRRWRSSSS